MRCILWGSRIRASSKTQYTRCDRRSSFQRPGCISPRPIPAAGKHAEDLPPGRAENDARLELLAPFLARRSRRACPMKRSAQPYPSAPIRHRAGITCSILLAEAGALRRCTPLAGGRRGCSHCGVSRALHCIPLRPPNRSIYSCATPSDCTVRTCECRSSRDSRAASPRPGPS